MSFLGLSGLLFAQLVFGHRVLALAVDGQWWPVVAFVFSLCGGLLYVLWARLRGPRMTPAIGTEAVILTGLVVVSVFVGAHLQKSVRAGGLESSGVSAARCGPLAAVQGVRISSSPLVVGDRVLRGGGPRRRLSASLGHLYLNLAPRRARVEWSFHDKKKMKQVFSSPVVVGDQLYIGEGLHEDQDCRIFCLSAGKGEKIWEFATDSHTESTPCVVDGRGLLRRPATTACSGLRAETGEQV